MRPHQALDDRTPALSVSSLRGKAKAVRCAYQVRVAFFKAWLRCPMGVKKEGPRGRLRGRGPVRMHHWRTIDRAIPWWVARQQSPPPFHPAKGMYCKISWRTRAIGQVRQKRKCHGQEGRTRRSEGSLVLGLDNRGPTPALSYGEGHSGRKNVGEEGRCSPCPLAWIDCADSHTDWYIIWGHSRNSMLQRWPEGKISGLLYCDWVLMIWK
jgi:hypothetical protein